jgi:hypothetical protein
MAGLSNEDLPPLRKRFRIDRHSRKFETTKKAIEEDAKRAARLRRNAKTRPPKRARKMRRLADLLDPKLHPETPHTLASARYMRKLRIRVIGHVWRRLVESGEPFVRYDIVKPGRAIAPSELSTKSGKAMQMELRADLRRAAKKLGFDRLEDVPGTFQGFVHGEYLTRDDLDPVLHLHWHAVATGQWVKVIKKMRKQRGYRKTRETKRPIVAHDDITDAPYALSYLLKSYWPAKWFGHVSGQGKNRRSNGHNRVPEPTHSDILLWLHKQSLSDLMINIGVRQSKKGFTNITRRIRT